eukprot:m.307098 g.307098  ORF g.307098 m.307098 type:complete len:149 (-) comp16357_c0_seq2:887-1333(-)
MMATEAAATDGAHSGGSGHAVTRATVSTSGKTLDLHFADGGTFRFHAAWLRDSTPSNVGQDEYRMDPQLVYRLPHVTATASHPVDHGTSLEVTFAYGGDTIRDVQRRRAGATEERSDIDVDDVVRNDNRRAVGARNARDIPTRVISRR